MLQLIVPVVRGLVCGFLFHALLLAPLVLNDLLELVPSIFWLGGQRASWHGHTKNV